MRRIIILTILGAMSLTVASGQGVDFFGGTLDEALSKAKSENKRVFMDFYTDWCGPCKAVAKNVFPTAEAGDYFNTHFINMSVDAEKGTGPALASEFGVNSYPTFLILNPDRSVASRWAGGSMNPTPEKFIGIVKTNLETGKGAGDSGRRNRPERRVQAERGRLGVDIFEGSYADALAKAKAENKMVFMDCYTQWCGPCKMMDAQVFPRKDVGEFMNPRFVFLKLDMENGEGSELNRRFDIRSYPTYIIIDAGDNEISRFSGYMQPDAFIAKTGAAIGESQTLETLQVRYDAGERGKEFMRQYIASLSAERKYVESAVAVAGLMTILTDEEKLAAEYWDYWSLYGYAPVFSPNFDFLIENQLKFKIGKDVVTDFIVKSVQGLYAEIAFDFAATAANGDAELLAKVNDLAKNKLDMEYNPTLALFRAAANAKVHGDTEGLVKTYEKYGRTILDAYTQRSFLIQVGMSLPGLTREQRERLASMTTDELTKKHLLSR